MISRGETQVAQPIRPAEAGTEIQLGEVFGLLWKYRFLIVGLAMAGAASGLGLSYLQTPVYHAEATFAPKDGKSGGAASGILSQLGGFGGSVAASLGMGNTSLDRLEVILKSRDLAMRIIQRDTLLPLLFPKDWNAAAGKWSSPDKEPKLQDAAELLRGSYLKVKPEQKKNIIVLAIDAPHPDFAVVLVHAYLDALREKIQQDVRSEADSNRKYLEGILSMTMDPLMREKIQNLIGAEIEKATLVSSRSFDLLESPVPNKRKIKPKRKKMAMMGMVFGALAAMGLALLNQKLGMTAYARRRKAP
jgi:uncharacterized protein involved in exopolysaccharide biosynthesis